MSPGPGQPRAAPSPRLRAPEVTREWPADGHRRDWLSPLVVAMALAVLAIPIAAVGLGLAWCLLVGLLAGLLAASCPPSG